jgi:hypothetical protein
MDQQSLLHAAAAARVMTFPSEVPGDPRNLDEVIAQIKGFTHKPKGRVTLFLGAAISTFTPTQLPMWNNFVELLWTSALAVATNEMASTGRRTTLIKGGNFC